MSFLDNIISWLSPKWGLERELARQTLASMKGRAYEAAAYGRRTNNWRANHNSATTEAGMQLHILRSRSREMVRNNGWASRAVSVIANNTVGTGVRPAFTVSGGKGKQNAEKALKLAWRQWADNTVCDFDGRVNLYGLQNLIMRAVAEGGEALIIKQMDGRKLKLRVLEGDYIDTNKHSAGVFMGTQEFDFYGVRFNAKGQRIGVWVYDTHPEFGGLTSTLYGEDQVIHVFEPLRAGQARGVPMGVAGFIRLRDLNDYEDAQLIRQKIAACFSVFVQQNSTGRPSDANSTDKYERVEPAMINYLAPGESVTFGNPPVVEGYEPYTRQVLRGIAAAYNVTYEALTNDYSNVNFSSGRMGWLEFHRNVQKWQRDIMQPALEKVFTWFMEYLAISQGFTGTAIAEWTAPRREMIDPVKETEAAIAQIRAGLKSYSEAIREMGYDPDDTLEEAAQFYAIVDKLGLQLTTDVRVQGSAPKEPKAPKEPAA